jgi:competence protein ComEA
MIRNFLAMLLALFALTAFAAVDVNQADRAALETVKGIGPGLSAKILDARKAGNFKSWDDLVDRVGGVGPGNAARFSQAGLTVGGAAFDGKATPAKATKTAKSTKEPKAAADGNSKPRKAKAAEAAPA